MLRTVLPKSFIHLPLWLYHLYLYKKLSLVCFTLKSLQEERCKKSGVVWTCCYPAAVIQTTRPESSAGIFKLYRFGSTYNKTVIKLKNRRKKKTVNFPTKKAKFEAMAAQGNRGSETRWSQRWWSSVWAERR